MLRGRRRYVGRRGAAACPIMSVSANDVAVLVCGVLEAVFFFFFFFTSNAWHIAKQAIGHICRLICTRVRTFSFLTSSEGVMKHELGLSVLVADVVAYAFVNRIRESI